MTGWLVVLAWAILVAYCTAALVVNVFPFMPLAMVAGVYLVAVERLG